MRLPNYVLRPRLHLSERGGGRRRRRGGGGAAAAAAAAVTEEHTLFLVYSAIEAKYFNKTARKIWLINACFHYLLQVLKRVLKLCVGCSGGHQKVLGNNFRNSSLILQKFAPYFLKQKNFSCFVQQPYALCQHKMMLG